MKFGLNSGQWCVHFACVFCIYYCYYNITRQNIDIHKTHTQQIKQSLSGGGKTYMNIVFILQFQTHKANM